MDSNLKEDLHDFLTRCVPAKRASVVVMGKVAQLDSSRYLLDRGVSDNGYCKNKYLRKMIGVVSLVQLHAVLGNPCSKI